jgi:hypothetical protein
MQSTIKFFKSSELESKNHAELNKFTTTIEETLCFLEDNSHIANHILQLEKNGNQWFEIAKKKPYFYSWEMITFYRCMEKLKSSIGYFAATPTYSSESFLIKFNQARAEHLPIIIEIFNKHQHPYEFSKIIWKKINDVYLKEDALIAPKKIMHEFKE